MENKKEIRITWEEWKASRAAKRELLKTHGLERPSRRKTSFSTSDARLRKTFSGNRVPTFS